MRMYRPTGSNLIILLNDPHYGSHVNIELASMLLLVVW